MLRGRAAERRPTTSGLPLSMPPTDVVVLGPQRLEPTVADTIAERLGRRRASYAVVTAGWEDREGEDDELRAHLCAHGGGFQNLSLFRRAEDVFQRDPELLQGILDEHERLKDLQSLYRTRLAHALDAARELLHGDPSADDDLVEVARAAAIEDVRRLDAEHLGHLRAEHERAWERLRPTERDAVVRHRAEIEGVLAGADVVCVAGGHVRILLNRLRLFDLVPLIGERPLFCWSAGAMALSERVVVFHDSPPWGAGNAEVLDAGVGLLRGLVPLPHASRRLRLDDPVRVGLFARRFGPDVCAVLDAGTRVDWDGAHWTAGPGTRRLREDGQLEEVAS